ncbi:MAG: hypothetical protein JXA71_07630 [Chitinispirillaceae bacterium]|nr:hypothetical protein [Chitinispirillaceae bacterium]
MNNHLALGFAACTLLTGSIVAQSIDSRWFRDLRGENGGHTTCAFLTLPTSAGA